MDASFFATLSKRKLRWGFVSGAEPPSARFVLQQRLGLQDPPLIAMGDAPDKPDPTGLIRLAKALGASAEGVQVAYLGDTVADVHTVIQARERWPEQPFVSLAVAPPHLQTAEQAAARDIYEQRLREAGADQVLTTSSLAGVLVAMLILAPEALNAIQAASAGEVQRSINTLYGSTFRSSCTGKELRDKGNCGPRNSPLIEAISAPSQQRS